MDWDIQPSKEEAKEATVQRVFKVRQKTLGMVKRAVLRAERMATKTTPEKFVERKYDIANYIGMADALEGFFKASFESCTELKKSEGAKWTKEREANLKSTQTYTAAEVIKELIERAGELEKL